MKKTSLKLSIGILFLIVLVSLSGCALKIISEESRTEEIARGVLLTEKRVQTSSGWVDLFILEADLSVEGVKVDAISSSNGVGKTQATSQMAKDAGALAAVNADFFYISSTGAPIGAQMSDGRLVKTSAPGLSGWTHFAVDYENIADFVYPVFLTNVIFADGSKRTVDGLNCEVDFTWSRITVFDRNFAKDSPGRDSIMIKNATDYTEVIVDGQGVVTDIRTRLPAVSIPEGGFVISASNHEAEFLRDKVKIGDVVTFNAYSDPSLDTLNTLMGGQPLLVDRGRLAPIGSSDIAGANPRTAVGISEDGKKVWLVVVDGRSSASKGFTLTEMAEYFKEEIGAYKALNLDGGGSSAMAVKKPGTDSYVLVNRPSDGGERRVPNGLGIFVDVEDSGVYNAQIRLESKGSFQSFVDETFNVALMSNLQKIQAFAYAADGSLIDNAKIIWEVKPEIAKIEYGFIRPLESGLATIEAKVAGTDIIAVQKIRILKEIKSLEVVPGDISVPADAKVPLYVVVTDTEDYSAYLDTGEVTWEALGDIGRVVNDHLVAGKDGASGLLLARYGDLKAVVPVAVGSNVLLLDDFEDPSRWTFSKYPADVVGSLEFSSEQFKSKEHSAKLIYDFTTTTATRAAYLNYNKELPGRPLALGVWVYGDGNGHWFRTEISDSAGTKKVLDFALKVDWEGWRYVTTEIPQDMIFPLNLIRIYLVEAKAELQDKGAIYVDDLEVVLPHEIPKELLESVK